jgi:hypothetical protein
MVFEMVARKFMPHFEGEKGVKGVNPPIIQESNALYAFRM